MDEGNDTHVETTGAGRAFPGTGSSGAELVADFIGGRVLAWMGGLAMAIGLVLLAVMASAGHRLGVPEQLGLAGAASVLLLLLGVWLHARGPRTEVSIVAVGAATVGMFVVLVMSARTATVPAAAATGASLIVGGLAATLAIRWAGRAVGWIGLLGAVAVPLAVGLVPDTISLGLLAIALAFLFATAEDAPPGSTLR